MKIAVLVKQVPDTYGDRRMDPATRTVDRGSADPVIDEINERAVEAALQIKEAGDGVTVTAVTMGPVRAVEALRKALAMGADSAVHICDDTLAGSDAMQTSEVLAAALAGRDFDLVIAGNESTDGRTAAVPAMLAERLGMAQLTFLRTVTVSGGSVSGERMTGNGYVEAQAPLPAVVSVTEQSAEPRFPKFRGIMAAKKKPLQTLTLAELGLPGGEAGGENSWSRVLDVTARPARTAGTVVTDDGTAGTQVAEYLAAAKLI
ncbi:electron transfer flavoprotein subunit beta/FixA family protein [Arthrobacter sp. I2-34]|uniref:Electron transfer flavoprotein subunit beta n=1 Tax=Arthrobacter hankyongi TaxID=2904801 RepID=A0ABS9L9Q4_9MICC|nr:electron transfer flavoprotein subunit beta/FixA family protein [Arthrobacter hankyongi]MCG2623416.1 electron transfer flavoprotein subunit beta/FixA family protein [Arthrobacter hankyongi]